MEVNIGEMNSRMHITDAASPLSSEHMEQIVRAVMTRLHEENQHRDQVDSERCLSSSVFKDSE
jgi:hypothetical protein